MWERWINDSALLIPDYFSCSRQTYLMPFNPVFRTLPTATTGMNSAGMMNSTARLSMTAYGVRWNVYMEHAALRQNEYNCLHTLHQFSACDGDCCRYIHTCGCYVPILMWAKILREQLFPIRIHSPDMLVCGSCIYPHKRFTSAEPEKGNHLPKHTAFCTFVQCMYCGSFHIPPFVFCVVSVASDSISARKSPLNKSWSKSAS